MLDPTAILQGLPYGIITTDAQQQITFVNRYACELLDYSNDALLNQPLLTMVPVLGDMASDDTSFHYNERIIRLQYQPPLTNDKQRSWRDCTLILTDAQREILDNRELGLLFACLIHDIHKSLSPTYSAIQLIAHIGQLNEDQTNFQQSALRSLKELTGTVQRFSASFQLQNQLANNLPIITFNVVDMVRQLIIAIQQNREENNTIQFESNDPYVFLRANKNLLSDVVRWLLTNGASFKDSMGEVSDKPCPSHLV